MDVVQQWKTYLFLKIEVLKIEVLKIESKVKDTSEMLSTIDNLNKSNTLTSDCSLVSFDIINMFPSIDNISGLKQLNVFLMLGKTNFHLRLALLKLLNCV